MLSTARQADLVDNYSIEGDDARVSQRVEGLGLAKHLRIVLHAVGAMQLLDCNLYSQPPVSALVC